MDNAIIARKVIHSMKSRKGKKKGFMAVKVEFCGPSFKIPYRC